MKAKNYLQNKFPALVGGIGIPFETVLTLMEAFAAHEVILYMEQHGKALRQTQDLIEGMFTNPKPHYGIPDLDNAIESAKMDAILDEDKMTIEDEDLHNDNHEI